MAPKRHDRKKFRVIAPWPDGLESPDDTAARVVYRGSNEHKDYPSEAGPPALRSDDTARCEPRLTDFAEVTEVLREAIRRECVGEFLGKRFPRYVWGWLNGRLYEARLINPDQGWYKAWPIEASERPRDPAKRLDWTT